MNIETRFDLGQIVWRVGRQKKVASDTCLACDGAGRHEIERRDGTTQKSTCEACRGRGKINEVWYDIYEIFDQSRIGQIEVRLQTDTARAYFGDPQVEERYMVEATGVGSGTVYPLRDGEWSHAHLFGSEEEAEAFCVAENVVLLADLADRREAARV